MIINEYRVINNCTEQEYQVGKYINISLKNSTQILTRC